jgi:hypothetical protein
VITPTSTPAIDVNAHVMIDDHVNNLTYDHPLFDPFWAAAEALNAFVLILRGNIARLLSK